MVPSRVFRKPHTILPSCRTSNAPVASTPRRQLSTCASAATERFGVHGEVYLWGKVVEHERGWRAQFAYPKTLFLVPDTIPFSLSEIDARLKTLTEFGTDIFILHDRERVALWKNGSGYDAAGLDYLINRRKEYYVRRGSERTLRKGDRVALLGLGIAVVEPTDGKEVGLVLGNRQVLRVARKDIALNQQNMRWECEANNARVA